MKNQKGITLIALIITIIVMLILVAVTINVALNGGLFTKAHDSALKTEKQSVYEQTVSAMVLDDNGDFKVDETGISAREHFIATLDSNATWEYDGETDSGTLTVHGKRGTYEIEISAAGIGQPTIKAGGDTPEGSTLISTITSEDYGKRINYSVTVNGTTLNNWKVFLNDNSNVYIIYGDYLEASLIPDEAGLVTNTENYIYNVWSNTDRNTLISGLTTTSYWSDFAAGVSGATATGSPTKEQLESSVGKGSLHYQTINGELYVPHYSEEDEYYDCFGYLLASPSDYSDNYVCYVDYDGSVVEDKYYYYDERFCVRPIVCLPSGTTGTVYETSVSL